jgi:hypothetical protein
VKLNAFTIERWMLLRETIGARGGYRGKIIGHPIVFLSSEIGDLFKEYFPCERKNHEGEKV